MVSNCITCYREKRIIIGILGGVGPIEAKMPKYQETANWLRQSIRTSDSKFGDKLISETNLCKKFNISRHTARGALAILEKEGLVVRKQGSGTYINHLQSDVDRKKIGILLTYADDYIFPSIISGIEEVLSKQSHMMSLSLTRNKVDNERTQILSLLSDNIDGLIVEAARSTTPTPNLDLFREFASRNIPVIFVNTYHRELECNYIINNDVKGGRLAARHLIENGHKRIGGIFKHDDIQGLYRFKGFVKELYDSQLRLHENNIIWYSTETLDSLFHPEQFKQLLRSLSDCSAAVCYNDQVAVKLLQSCNQEGIIIPQDLSIVSFDNSALSKTASVPLSSITHPGAEMGRLAAESLLKILDNPKMSVHHVCQPLLEVRNSVQIFDGII